MPANRTVSQDTVATSAAEWHARLRAADVSEVEAMRFRAWLAGDPARRREFEGVDTFWEDLAAIEHSPEVQRVRDGIAAHRSHRTRLFPVAIAATVLAAVAAAWSAWQYWGPGHYVTRVGEQRLVPLADGSVVTLNTATDIRIQYSQHKREIQLIRGQANFEVAKDPARPFIVTAGGAQVRALGTEFDVYESDSKVTVTLIEGQVAVTPNESSPAAPADSRTAAEATSVPHSASEVILGAGEQMSFPTMASGRASLVAEASRVVKLSTADVPRVSAWRARKLDFSDTPLREAIGEANRYSNEQIVLEAPDLATARISGTFEAGKNEALVEGLQTYFHLDLQRPGGHKLLLRQRAD